MLSSLPLMQLVEQKVRHSVIYGYWFHISRNPNARFHHFQMIRRKEKKIGEYKPSFLTRRWAINTLHVKLVLVLSFPPFFSFSLCSCLSSLIPLLCIPLPLPSPLMSFFLTFCFFLSCLSFCPSCEIYFSVIVHVRASLNCWICLKKKILSC